MTVEDVQQAQFFYLWGILFNKKGVPVMEYDKRDQGSFPPWSRIPSLQEMTDEAGVDHDRFIQLIKEQKTIEEIARIMEISPQTVQSLHHHFMHYGIGSVMGGD